MAFQFLLLLFGIAFLILGANLLVSGASGLAKRFRVSDLVIGLTIVAFSTSAPELVVNSIASFENHQEMVFGNIIGSNIFNLFAILGIAAVLTPLTVPRNTIWKEIPLSLLAVFLLLALANDFQNGQHLLSVLDGFLLLVFFGLFLLYSLRQPKAEPEAGEINTPPMPQNKILVYMLLGLSGLVFGGNFVVESATNIASGLGISEKIVGFTVIAIGTSLPELATTLVAAIRKNTSIAVGNIIGSNIFNIFLILGTSAVIRPIPFKTEFNTDLFVLAGGTVFLFIAMFTGKKRTLERWEAIILLTSYFAYTFYLFQKEG